MERCEAGRIARAIETLRQKWAVGILCQLRHGPVRLGQLTRVLPYASKKALTANLRWLERAGVILRRDLSKATLHIEYDVRDSVRAPLTDLLRSLAVWGDTLLNQTLAPSAKTPKAKVVRGSDS